MNVGISADDSNNNITNNEMVESDDESDDSLSDQNTRCHGVIGHDVTIHLLATYVYTYVPCIIIMSVCCINT